MGEEGTQACGKLWSCHLIRYFVGRVPRPGSAISTSLVATKRLRARRAWVTDIPARRARRCRGRATASADADRTRTVKTFVAEGGRWLRTEGKGISAPPGCHLTTSACRANLLVAITAPSQLGGNAPAPRCPRGVSFSFPAVISPASAGSLLHYTHVNIQFEDRVLQGHLALWGSFVRPHSARILT